MINGSDEKMLDTIIVAYLDVHKLKINGSSQGFANKKFVI